LLLLLLLPLLLLLLKQLRFLHVLLLQLHV
jgi:hypothetical protein